jgi:hypothetical protein
MDHAQWTYKTLSLIIQRFALEHNQENDNANHRQSRNLISTPIDPEDDVEFTEQEITNVIHDTGNQKAPGQDRIHNEV